ncbi:MAG TPA: DUF421 domain-containing protein [Nitrospira sp.]|nr:DUF421 domain-containing protein [Nitrospira sp.]MCW5795308.1 DUF421 domain-containing protein [Nitrospira sp.]HMU29658.1 DUF421 domain-containing protein [Nitrospira sp.]HMV58717.1 DUF421 domain-containing protein [Nitrospira sp.]HMW85651.1 DUF421 domain-containing protein [Nitrospira sp.]
MDAILRGFIMYLFLLVLFRIAGRRTLGQMTNFDFVLLLIISEATQNAMIGNDFSVTNGILVILSLVGLDIGFSILKQRFPILNRHLDGLPLVLVDQGRPVQELMRKTRVDEEDILFSAREKHGLERMEQIKYAVLETNGGISIIPKAAE